MITIYTRPRCIWCWKAKRLLRRAGVTFETHDVSAVDARQALERRTNWPTVPQVFVGDRFIGGYQELRAIAERGELRSSVG
jgi:glutaredoxin 3